MSRSAAALFVVVAYVGTGCSDSNTADDLAVEPTPTAAVEDLTTPSPTATLVPTATATSVVTTTPQPTATSVVTTTPQPTATSVVTTTPEPPQPTAPPSVEPPATSVAATTPEPPQPTLPPDDAKGFVSCPGSSPAHEVFNAFWSTLDQQYAVFEYRLGDRTWGELGADACAEITADLDNFELYDVLLDLARNLDDGHTSITAADIDRDDDAWVNIYPYYDEVAEAEFNAEDNYLDDGLTWAANDWFGWGTIGNTGYLSITSMEELSDSGDEDDDQLAAAEAMAAVLDDFTGVSGVVVDVRANEGGWDYVGLEVARFFDGPAAVAWSTAVRNGPSHGDFGDEVTTTVEASTADAISVPTVVLSSGGTFSAAETFLLAMRVRSHVTLLGERSSGHFSDLSDAVLPGGWEMTFSGLRYRAADGQVYEAAGVPMDIELGLDPAALEEGQDVMLEAALELLASKS